MNQQLTECAFNGFTPRWHMWECIVCGKRVQSVAKPIPMWWEEDHQCSFEKLDRFGNIPVKTTEELIDELSLSLDKLIERRL